MNQHPTSFLSAPQYHPQPTAITPSEAVSSREWPTLTVYRDGMANLNALATELFRSAERIALVAPPAVQRGRLPKAWQLHGSSTEGVPLFGRNDRGLLRFRSVEVAKSLFAEQASCVAVLRFVLTPEPGHSQRFRLLPI
jgi:hypothetical protein